VVLAAHYRSFQLPWDADAEQNRRFRRHVLAALAFVLVAGIIVPLVELPAPEIAPEQAVPERLVQLMQLDQPKPPPPPPKEEPKPLPVPPKPVDVPRPVDRAVQARQKAEATMSQYKDAFADLRQTLSNEPVPQTRNLTGSVGAAARAERSVIASRAGTGSAGVASTNASRGFGSGAGSLTGHSTTAVRSAVGDEAGRANVTRKGQSGKAARSPEEIELVFDRHKGAIYALYSRALREKSDLQGKLVLEFTIAPSGEVTACRVLSSELQDADLERKIVARVRQIRFEAKDVEVMTTTKPIEFFPA
jgi:TonB family protein